MWTSERKGNNLSLLRKHLWMLSDFHSKATETLRVSVLRFLRVFRPLKKIIEETHKNHRIPFEIIYCIGIKCEVSGESDSCKKSFEIWRLNSHQPRNVEIEFHEEIERINQKSGWEVFTKVNKYSFNGLLWWIPRIKKCLAVPMGSFQKKVFGFLLGFFNKKIVCWAFFKKPNWL